VPEVFTYRAAISVCDKRQQHRQAFHLLRAIPRQAIAPAGVNRWIRAIGPEVSPYSAAISVCAQRQQHQ